MKKKKKPELENIVFNISSISEAIIHLSTYKNLTFGGLGRTPVYQPIWVWSQLRKRYGHRQIGPQNIILMKSVLKDMPLGAVCLLILQLN